MPNRFTTDAYDCKRVSGLLPMYVNGRLTAEEVVIVAAHLMACEECRGELTLLARLRSDVKKAEGEKSSDALASAFDLIRIKREGTPRKRHYLPEIPRPQCLVDAKKGLELTVGVVKKTLDIPAKLLERLLA